MRPVAPQTEHVYYEMPGVFLKSRLRACSGWHRLYCQHDKVR